MTVRLQDRENAVDARLLRLSVYPHDGLLVTSRVLPAAILGEDYSFPLEAMGGIPPYFFALRGGAYLPPGLTLDRTGKLSGKAGEKGVFGFVVDAVDGNNLQGSASYTMAVLDADELSADSQGFTVREYESEKRIRLNFYLPESFSEAEVMAVNALVSPDAYVAGSGSSVTRGQNGEYETGLTLYASESALKGGVSWRELIDSVSLDGIVVRFADASGEEVRFAEAIPVREMKREEGDKGDTGDDGGGCDAGFGAFAFPGTIAFFAAALKTKKKRR